MKTWANHNKTEILSSILQEVAKAQNEIRCAKGDLEKATNRLAFCLSAVNHLTQGDMKNETK